MRLSRFFIDETLTSGQTLSLPAHLVNYIVNVLRLKQNSSIILFNGQTNTQPLGEFNAILVEISKRHCKVLIGEFIEVSNESPIKTHLFQGISRSERMDYTIQKAVELGVNSITPVSTQYSNSRKLNNKQLQKKMLHWQGVASSACEQSGRVIQVEVKTPITVQDMVEHIADFNLLLSPTGKKTVSQLNLTSENSVNIFIGPEGGLSPEEISLAQEYGYLDIPLGGRILRTETAGLAILSILQFLWGDLR
jgi:16S rRNA (uracil1498-N3)-methyltransferase